MNLFLKLEPDLSYSYCLKTGLLLENFRVYCHF